MNRTFSELLFFAYVFRLADYVRFHIFIGFRLNTYRLIYTFLNLNLAWMIYVKVTRIQI